MATTVTAISIMGSTATMWGRAAESTFRLVM